MSSVTAPAPSVQDVPRSAAAFIADHETEETVRRSFSELALSSAHLARGGVEDAYAFGQRGRTPGLLLVDVSRSDDPMPALRKLSEACDPDTAVIVIGEHNDIALYRSVKDLGITEYFYKPVLGDLLTRVCDAALSHTEVAQPHRAGKLIIVVGVRGGVGATTVATNVAWHLSEIKQRRVALVDLDMQNGDVALQLDAPPSNALREALEHPDRIDSLFIERAVTRVTSRLDILASLEEIGDPHLPSDEAAYRLISTLQQRYRYVVVDVPGPIAPSLPKTMRAPGTLVLVSDGTLASARDVGRWRSLASSGARDGTVLHVLNMQGMSGDLPAAEWERAFGRAPDAVIAYDRRIPVAATRGQAAIQVSRSLQDGLVVLFRQIAGESEPEPRSLLARLFGR